MGIEALRNGNRRSWKRPRFRFIPFSILHFPPFFFLLTYFRHCFRAYGLRLLILLSVLSEDPFHVEFCRYHTASTSLYYYYFLFPMLYYWKIFYEIRLVPLSSLIYINFSKYLMLGGKILNYRLLTT